MPWIYLAYPRLRRCAGPAASPRRAPGRPLMLRGAVLAPAPERLPVPRVRSHCRVINKGTELVCGCCIKWMCGSTERQCDRAQAVPRGVAPPVGGQPEARLAATPAWMAVFAHGRHLFLSGLHPSLLTSGHSDEGPSSTRKRSKVYRKFGTGCYDLDSSGPQRT
jgi:hypothetical protein